MIGERVISVAGCVVDGVLHPLEGLHKLEDNLEAQLWAWLLPELPRPGSSRDSTHRVVSAGGAGNIASRDGAGRAASRDSADTIA